MLTNRGGLLAFDVGVGKTYTGLAVVAGARQEGWAKRPVILVPNSIVWKWVADIRRALPDFRVGVVGSKHKIVAKGERKGFATSDVDTPAERAATWTRFQAGEFDVVLLTYSAMPRTKLNEESIRQYAQGIAAIEREVALRRRNAGKKEESKKKTDLTEREQAILNEGIAAWTAEQLELPAGWEPDSGIFWEDIGCDLLIVDEAQNYKNLFLPEPREGGVPRFMGSAGEGAKRAWQLAFRAAAVRRKTGGAGVVLLSATPAKNSPLEFLSLLAYVVDKPFGALSPEEFIDRYCNIEIREVVDAKMDVIPRGAVTGFKNLPELKEGLFRWAEFKTAEDVGLELPEPEVRLIEVDLNPQQAAKYERYMTEIEAALDNPMKSKGAILGALARMALVAIHPNLDEQYTWKTAPTVPSPHSPKFDALANEIQKQPNCGHIVFCDNVAAHAWIRMVLEEAGIPRARIAILNAEVAEAAADRQRIATEFNGSPEEGIAPKYDVVIANAVAYEGIDLQKRTCAIHHIDLPWEPATLQQRNGRGVRQGNTLAAIAINYYFARRSQDGLRFNLIQGKRGWMADLLQGQARETNNPGAQLALGPEEILLLVSRDPEKTRARLDAMRVKREAEAKAKIAEEASRTLRAAVHRFARARSASNVEEAARLRSEAEQRLEDLARVDPAAWPWAGWSLCARDRRMLALGTPGPPVYEGLRIALPNTFDATVLEHAEFGKVRENAIAVRRAGSPVWRLANSDEITRLNLRPEHRTETWPLDDEERLEQVMRDRFLPDLRRPAFAERTWRELGWAHATPAFLNRAWPRLEGAIIEALNELRNSPQEIPVAAVLAGALQIGVHGEAVPLPPTEAGWEEFKRLAPASGLKFEALARSSEFWFGRSLPRDLLSQAKKESEQQ